MRLPRWSAALLAIPVLASAGSRGLVTLDDDAMAEVHRTFDAGAAGARVVVFFSSACAACDVGSATLEARLDQLPGPLTVLAVWEPIGPSDLPPTDRILKHLHDPRVTQLWDPDHRMSKELRAAELAHPGSIPQASMRMDQQPDGILYDTVVVFAPGDRWDGTLPAPAFFDGGLDRVLDPMTRLVTSYAGR